MNTHAAIIGSGNIATDLLYKAMRSERVTPVWMVGIDPRSDGLSRAGAMGVKTTAGGIDALLPHVRSDRIRIAFDATSAGAHPDNAKKLCGAGVLVIDLTPAAIGPYCVPPVGHHNLGLGIANSLAALQAGACRIDASAAGLGAGAGNTPLEVMVAVLDRVGAVHGVDLYRVMDVAEDIVVPMMDHPVRIDRDALILGYAGVYSSFLLFAKQAGNKYGVSSRDILIELGRRKTVGGQEDMIEDIALDMAKGGVL